MSQDKKNRRWFITTTSAGLVGLGACGTDSVSKENSSTNSPSEPQGSIPPSSSVPPTTPQDPTQQPPPPQMDCIETTADIKGPFYREDPPSRINIAQGEVGTPLTIRGKVFANDCETPLNEAVVDVWQADNSGGYDNSSDEYRLRGQMKTNSQGEYEFQSILPGRYLNGSTYRPRHIHYSISYSISPDQTTTLVTQLYFEGDEFLETDPWAEESRTIPLEDTNGRFIGTFDIVLAVPA